MQSRSSRTRIVIPLRSFSSSKRRLAGVLDADQREMLARTMAEQVVDAARGWPIAVACDDDVVETWARSVGAEVIRTDGHDLNGSAMVALTACRNAGWQRVAFVHADLPLITSFGHILDGLNGSQTTGVVVPPISDTVLIAPDRRMTGTNVLVVPCHADFGFAYGPGSFELHRRAARRAGLGVQVIHDRSFAWDMDEPDDLMIPPGRHMNSTRIRRLVESGILTEATDTESADQ